MDEFKAYLDELTYAIAELGELDKKCTSKARKAAKKVLRAFKKIEEEHVKLFGEPELSKVYTVAASIFALLLEAIEEYGAEVTHYALDVIYEMLHDPRHLREAMEVFRIAEKRAKEEYGFDET